MSLLNIDCKTSEKWKELFLINCINIWNPNDKKSQHGFNIRQSVLKTCHTFWPEIFRALDNNSNDSLVAFSADFSKYFDHVKFWLLQKTWQNRTQWRPFRHSPRNFWRMRAVCLVRKPAPRRVATVDRCTTNIIPRVSSILYLYQQITQNHEIQWTIEFCHWVDNCKKK